MGMDTQEDYLRNVIEYLVSRDVLKRCVHEELIDNWGDHEEALNAAPAELIQEYGSKPELKIAMNDAKDTSSEDCHRCLD